MRAEHDPVRDRIPAPVAQLACRQGQLQALGRSTHLIVRALALMNVLHDADHSGHRAVRRVRWDARRRYPALPERGMVDAVFDGVTGAISECARQRIAGAHCVFLMQQAAHPRPRVSPAGLNAVYLGGAWAENDGVIADVPAPVTQASGGQGQVQALGRFAQLLLGALRFLLGALARREDAPCVLQGSGAQQPFFLVALRH